MQSDVRTRADVYSESTNPLSEADLQRLLTAFDARFQRLNDRYLREMGEHIRRIGQMLPSEVHRLQQIRIMNRNLSQLERQIARAAGTSVRDVHDILTRNALADARIATRILGVPDITSVKGNPWLERVLEAQYRETGGLMQNLSNTTVVSDYYRDAVDEAVNAVQVGVDDYGKAIRRVVRNAGQAGLRIRPNGTAAVDYASGYSRRLDTAARMNILDGVRHLNQNVMSAAGKEFGADGIEIDAHMLCAEDHLPYQGYQYSNEEFEQIQDGLQRPFGEWNCRHFWHPILLNISPRTYTDLELSEMRVNSSEQVTIDGRTKSRYQWSQEQRRIETAIRAQKDTAKLAESAGDTDLQRRCQANILRLNTQYNYISANARLDREHSRAHVEGFSDYND